MDHWRGVKNPSGAPKTEAFCKWMERHQLWTCSCGQQLGLLGNSPENVLSSCFCSGSTWDFQVWGYCQSVVPTTRASGSRKAAQSGFRAPNRHQEVLDEMSMLPQACQSAKVGPIWTQSGLILNLISLLCGSSSPFSEFLLTIPLSRSIFCPCSCSLRIRDEGSSPIPLHIRNTEELGNYRKLGPEK